MRDKYPRQRRQEDKQHIQSGRMYIARAGISLEHPSTFEAESQLKTNINDEEFVLDTGAHISCFSEGELTGRQKLIIETVM